MMLPNFQRISKKLIDYYSQSINKLPEGLKGNIEATLKNHIEFGEKILDVEETKDIIRHYHQEYLDFLSLEFNEDLRTQFHTHQFSDTNLFSNKGEQQELV